MNFCYHAIHQSAVWEISILAYISYHIRPVVNPAIWGKETFGICKKKKNKSIWLQKRIIP